jgi:hypothetical protein
VQALRKPDGPEVREHRGRDAQRLRYETLAVEALGDLGLLFVRGFKHDDPAGS